MRAIVLDADGSLSLQDRPKPSAPGECLIKVTAAGICGTDLELRRGYAGFHGIPGHEFVGIVENASEADARWIGRRGSSTGRDRSAGFLWSTPRH